MNTTATTATTANSLAYNICATIINNNSNNNQFINAGEWLQACNKASKLLPADYQLAKIDRLVCQHTAFNSMAELLSSAPNYRPTIYCTKAAKASTRIALKQIADYYDECMKQIGDARKAYRI